MKYIEAAKLAKTLGISDRTMRDICRNDKKLAYKRDGVYWIRVAALAACPGMDEIKALLILESGKWVKVIDFARAASLPERTVRSWAATRPNFAIRLGKIWYISVEMLARNEEEAAVLGDIGKKDTLNERQA